MLLKAILLLVIALSVWSVLRLHFEEDISSFLPQDTNNKRINYASQHLGSSNKIMINVASNDSIPDQELIIEAVEFLAQKLQENDSLNHIKDVFYVVDQQKIVELSSFIAQNMPYYLSDDDYQRIDSLIHPNEIENKLNNNKSLLLTPMGSFIKTMIALDPLSFSSSILKQLNNLQSSESFHTYNGYIFNKNETEAMISVASNYPVSETKYNALLINDINKAISETEQEFDQKVTIGAIGAAIISITNAEQIKRDSFISTGLAFILILLLLMYFFRDVRALFLILFSIVFGGLFGLAFLSIFQDSVSIIAIGAGSIIVGIAVNYPLHFLAHYQQGYSKEEIIKDIVSPLVTGNITTVGAFLSLIFISSDAMKDLGLFSSMLLAGTIIFVLIFLPHLFGKKLFSKQTRQNDKLTFKRIASFNPEKSKILVGLIVLLTIPLFILSKKTSFETDMSTINYMTDAQRQKLNKLLEETESKNPTLFCVAEGKDMEEALQNYEILSPILDSMLNDSMILNRGGIGIFLPSQALQKEKLEKWNNFWSDKREEFLKEFKTILQKTGFKAEAFQSFEKMITKDFQVEDFQYFSPIISNMAENYLSDEKDCALVYTILKTSQENISNVEENLDNINENIFSYDNSSLITKMVNALSGDFDYVLYICSILVFVFLTISFGRLELSILAFLPLAIGWVWILGLMNLFDMKFNIVNIILATFIFGQGDDYTIFVTEGLMYEYTHKRKMLASYKNSILLSAFIMFIGIGALIISKHPAMKSLAEVTMIGMFSVVLMAYIFPPLIYRWLTTRKGKKRLLPITLLNLLKTIFSFIGFLIGSILLTIIGFFVLTIGGKTEKHKLFYHKCVCYTFRFLAKIILQLPYNVINNAKETFDKPGIIICNHQSHIDLMYTLMLNPKIIVLTNQWVWKSPFYGWILRYADYYPIADGIEENIEKLQDSINKGYSILIFPEGTRSEDCSILRFHKGAFYLAEKLNLDIVPVIIHGIGHALPKKEFLLRKGKVTIKILDRIKSKDAKYRSFDEIRLISQSIREMYQIEYEKLVEQNETTDYYKDLVYHNYIYKGIEIERYAKRLLKKFNNFKEQISQLPEIGNVLILNCGQGEMALMAALVRKNINFTATDFDNEKFEIAENCISVPKNLCYQKNIDDYTTFDNIIVFDPDEEQLKQINDNKAIIINTK